MDLSKMTVIKTTNPKGQNFRLKFNPTKESFTFSHELFAELQLEYNSLSQYDNEEGKAVIGICPGDSGQFYKKRSGAKGKTVKSAVLTKILLETGVLRGNLDLVSLGENEGVHYYEVVQEGNTAEQPDWVEQGHGAPDIETSQSNVVEDKFA